MLTVHMNNFTKEEKVFDATLSLQKKPMTAIQCARALTLFPVMTLKVIAGIYWEALRLFVKRTPFYSHPEKTIHPSQGGANQAN